MSVPVRGLDYLADVAEDVSVEELQRKWDDMTAEERDFVIENMRSQNGVPSVRRLTIEEAMETLWEKSDCGAPRNSAVPLSEKRSKMNDAEFNEHLAKYLDASPRHELRLAYAIGVAEATIVVVLSEDGERLSELSKTLLERALATIKAVHKRRSRKSETGGET